ncbi:patatin-like phospholipase family protein [Microvirga sp. M2]|uniref:patatin-like phospholipase family protein n=1 Tax=Microvirga sp. M2 TaxID=3073270 RepID=UPI0039C46D47
MTRRKIGVALAGGGPLGAIWELGALCALDEALIGLDLTDCDVFVGVSAGAFVAAGLANRLSPKTMRDILIEREGIDNPLEPELLLQPAVGEYLSRVGSLPRLVAKATRRYFAAPQSRGLVEAFQELARALPTGLFNNAPIGDYLVRLLSDPELSNDFRTLPRQLFVVATDLDTNETVAFGAPGWDDVPISRAVQASTALPGLYPPVEIHGHYFVDGALMKTLHASIALREGATLLICVNPLVPFDSVAAAHRSHRKPASIVEWGLPAVLSQTFRSIIYSRMQVALSGYGRDFPNADVLLFEPRRDDAEMFFTNIFSYADRHSLSEHAYQATRADLRNRFDELAPIFARHGVELDRSVLADPARTLAASGIQFSSQDAKALSQATSHLRQTLDALDHCLSGVGTAHRSKTKRSPKQASAPLPDSSAPRGAA